MEFTMKKVVMCYAPKRLTLPKKALVLAMVITGATSAYAQTPRYSRTQETSNVRGTYDDRQRDPSYMTNTISDCVHGSTGIGSNQDCTRNHVSRHSTDTSFYNADTTWRDGGRLTSRNY